MPPVLIVKDGRVAAQIEPKHKMQFGGDELRQQLFVTELAIQHDGFVAQQVFDRGQRARVLLIARGGLLRERTRGVGDEMEWQRPTAKGRS